MKTSTLTKYASYAIAVLTATLLNQLILSYVKNHISQQGYWLVLIDMAVVVLIFAPAFAIVVHFSKKFSNAYLKTSKKVGRSSRKGVLWGILCAGIILFACYAYYRHGLNIVADITIWTQTKTATFF